MESSPLAQIVQTLASLHKTQHQALLKLCKEHMQSIQALLEAQAEDWQVLWSLGTHGYSYAGTPAASSVAAMAIGPQDDPEAFLELFECAVVTWG